MSNVDGVRRWRCSKAFCEGVLARVFSTAGLDALGQWLIKQHQLIEQRAPSTWKDNLDVIASAITRVSTVFVAVIVLALVLVIVGC